MASREYCTNVSAELEEWSQKLHDLSSEIDHISTGEKYQVFPQIEKLHMIMAELDERLGNLSRACPTTMMENERLAFEHEVIAPQFNLTSNERFDYEFGG